MIFGKHKYNGINQSLLRAKEIDNNTRLKIEKLQKIRCCFYDIMEVTDDKTQLRNYSNIITQINYQLQRLWGFKLDSTKHDWYNIPKCSCPKSDNNQYWGINNRIINKLCIIHGEE